ncbi:hypothetical protein CPC08DRAFT_315281 [Agrocybe pediades]|nr:hypothetical protein CPC08DRAFT_315281 [Agrocybe pediades]
MWFLNKHSTFPIKDGLTVSTAPFSLALIMTELPTNALDVLGQLEIVRYGCLATEIAFMYDHVITLGAEVNLVWRGKRSLVTVLFLLIRYYTLALMIAGMYLNLRVQQSLTPEVSDRNIRFHIISVFLSGVMTEAVLQLRVYALYYQNKKVLTFMLVGYTVTTATSAWILASGMRVGRSSTIQIPGGSTCTFPVLGKNLAQAWIPFTVYDAILCAIVVYRGYMTYNSQHVYGEKGRILINVMVRDSVLSFICLAISYVATLLAWKKSSPIYVQIPGSGVAALSGIFSSRMILNIRDQTSKQGSANGRNDLVLTTFNIG